VSAGSDGLAGEFELFDREQRPSSAARRSASSSSRQ